MSLAGLRRRLVWLYPGIRIKRYLLLFAAGVLAVAAGLAGVAGRWLGALLPRAAGYGDRTGSALGGALLAASGLAVAIWSVGRLLGTIARALAPGTVGDAVAEVLFLQRQLGRGPRVVALGGGTGLSVLLRGIKEYTSNITAVVTVTDDGGSSGRLREEMGVLPPGDIRNCLAALADTEPLMEALFQHRFRRGSLEGHAVGNVLVTALAEMTGDFVAAVRAASHVLAVRGQVLPSTAETVVLCAELQDGRRVCGETAVARAGGRIARVFLVPPGARALPEAVRAIEEAEVIILGPGSLYTSLLPHLALPELREALVRSRASKYLVVNVMTQPGETDGYTAADHLRAVVDHAGPGAVDTAVVHVGRVPPARLAPYRDQGAEPVRVDREDLEAMGVRVLAADLVTSEGLVRHDPVRLATVLLADALARTAPPEPGRFLHQLILQERLRKAIR